MQDTNCQDEQETEAQQFTPEAMMHCVGIKHVKATPMTLGYFRAYMDKTIGDSEDVNAPGYLVEYVESPNPNHRNHAGYVSWSPEGVFNKAYAQVTANDAEEAMAYLNSVLSNHVYNG